MRIVVLGGAGKMGDNALYSLGQFYRQYILLLFAMLLSPFPGFFELGFWLNL